MSANRLYFFSLLAVSCVFLGCAVPPVANAQETSSLPIISNIKQAISSYTSDTQQAAAGSADNAPPTEGNKSPEYDSSVVGSIMFTPEEISSINSAVAAYERRRSDISTLDEDDFLKKLENISPENKAAIQDPNNYRYLYPQFFLSSIMYHSPTDWSVWINGERFSQDSKAHSKLKIVGISKDKVTMEWRPDNMNMVKDTGDLEKNSSIKVDWINGKVTFSLSGNQTFSSSLMKIVEGKVAPSAISVKDSSSEPSSSVAVIRKAH